MWGRDGPGGPRRERRCQPAGRILGERGWGEGAPRECGWERVWVRESVRVRVWVRESVSERGCGGPRASPPRFLSFSGDHITTQMSLTSNIKAVV